MYTLAHAHEAIAAAVPEPEWARRTAMERLGFAAWRQRRDSEFKGR